MWVGVAGLCQGAVPLELRQVCIGSLVLFFQRSGGKRITEPDYDGYSGLRREGDIRKTHRYLQTHRYAEQLS